MSSLRIALKQSLQDSGQLGGNKKPRSNRNRGGGTRKKRRPGDTPRKRGRPKGSTNKQHRGNSPRRRRDSEEEGEERHYGHHSSSEEENEFSAGEEEHSEDEDDHTEEEGEEEEESDGHSRHDEEEEEQHQQQQQHNVKSNHSTNQRSQPHEEEEEEEEEGEIHPDEHQHENDSHSEEEGESDEERRRQQRKLHKKLKHSAANKIQNQWKKKKEGGGSDTAEPEATTQEAAEVAEPVAAEEQDPQENAEQETSKAEADDQHEEGVERKKKKKSKGNNERGGGKGKTAKTVPPPEPEVLEWNRALPVKRARRNVAQGLRVKVRFATKVKREGKILRKKKWFGGRVSAVSKEGSKIRIKYDDGTAEISKFPDKDVVVCDAFNGQHQCDASKFQPPQHEHEAGSMVMEEERAPTPPKPEKTEKKQSPPSSPPLEAEPKLAKKPTQEERTASPRMSPQNANESQLDEASKPASKSEEGRKPSPKPEARKPSPVSEPMEEEIVRAPSPPVPEIRPPSPPIPEIGMVSSAAAPTKLIPTTTSERPNTPPPPSPPKAAESVPPVEPMSPGEIVPDAKESTTEPPPPPHIMEKGKGEETHVGKNEEVEQAEEKITIKEPSNEERSYAAEQTKDLVVLAESETASQSATSMEEEQVALSKPKPSTDVESMSIVKEKSAKTVKMEMDSSEQTIPKEKAAPQAKPSLTIRLPNPNKERRASGTEPKSPRIKISKLALQEIAGEEILATRKKHDQSAATEEPTATSSGRKSPTRKDGGRKSPKPEGAFRAKRRRSEEESELKSDVNSAGEPPTKRMNVQRLAVLEKGEEPENSSVESRAEKEAAVDPKPKRSSSRQSDEALPPKDPSIDRGVDEGDDGPVKIVGRVSAKRVPLFSDEEDSVAEKPKLEKKKEGPVLQKPKPKPVKPTPAVKEQEEVTASQDAAANKVTAPDSAPDETSTFKRDKEKVVLSSRNSAFERKDETKSKPSEGDKETPSRTGERPGSAEAGIEAEAKVPRPTTPREKPTSALTTPVVRSGRRAAALATERIVQGDKEKEKEKEKEPATEGKKRKRKEKERHDEDSESSNEDVNNWVQCYSCKKWRIIPNHIPISSLPERWYCNLNVDPKRNTCEAPEQTARTPVVLAKNKKKNRRKKKRAAEAAEAAIASEQKTLHKVDSQQDVAIKDATAKEKPRVRSPTPKDEVKSKEKDSAKSKEKETPITTSASKTMAKPPRASPNSVSIGSAESALQQADSEPPPTKKSKHEKKTKRLPDEPLETIPEVAPPPPEAKKRGRKPRKEKENTRDQDDQNTNSSFQGSVSSVQGEPDPDNVEWVQCDSCGKWRKLPSEISADELPDVWYCKDNTWNPKSASCDAPEDKADGQQDLPSSPSPSTGKLSYRNLIFGSGRKVNRPVSERTRAAESIFVTPDDSECPYPTVMYANSSAFAPRGSRAAIIEDEDNRLSVFDLMHHSNLFAELRGSSQTLGSDKIEPAGFSKPFLAKYSYETIPRAMRQDMKDLILKSMGNATLLGEEVALACRSLQWDSAPPSWYEARTYCTADAVTILLCELVTEGKVQLVQAFGKDWTVRDWNPRYRLADNATNEIENAEPPMPKTRALKIAKPWKVMQP